MYKDKDSYEIKNSLVRQKKKEDMVKRISSVLIAFDLFIFGIVVSSDVKYKFDHNNPFNGSVISSSDFSANYKAMRARSIIEDETFKETIEYIKNANIDEKKAYLLYYSLVANQDLTAEEKKNLCGYIQYFIDNKYLDYEYVYNKLCSFIINPDNPDLLDKGIAGSYSPKYNSITFAGESERVYSNSHEIYHAEDKNVETEQAWLTEGLTALLDYEYHNKVITYDMEATFCRILCEFIDSDILLETRAKGDINILISALVNKGLKKEEVTELFDLFNKYRWERKEENQDFDSIKIEILELLRKMYLEINNDKDYVKPMLYEHLTHIFTGNYDSTSPSQKYYFNTLKKQKIPTAIDNYVRKYDPDGNIHIGEDIVICQKSETIEQIKEYYDNCIVITEKIIDTQGVQGQTTKIFYITQEKFNLKVKDMILSLSEQIKTK